jgi:hypothetical protein
MIQRLLLAACAVLVTTLVVSARQQTPAIPQGPDVQVSDGWYHVPSCSIAQGRQAPSMPLADALRQKMGPCPFCEPHKARPEIGEFVAAHGTAIADDVRRKAEEADAEAKRKAAEEEAGRLKRIAAAEEARKNKEAAPLVRLAETQVRALAEKAIAQAGGDATAFQREFRALVRAEAPDYNGPATIFGSGTLRITLAGPIASFERAVMDALPKGQPPARVPWSADATIFVEPQQAESPDIERVVVQRSDASRPLGSEIVIAPLSSTLAARPLQFVSGATRTLHAGQLVFPLNAFDPGAGVMVRVIAVPAGAAPINRTFTSLQLRAIQ